MATMKVGVAPSAALYVSMFFLIWACPFTKVEESFNMQGMHDILNLLSLGDFDHLEFPGVVPRTFIGALTVSIIVIPVHLLLTTGLGVTKMVSQYLVRIVLGTLLWASFVYFADALNRRFRPSRRIGDIFLYLSALQFHVPFYMSRTLPNTFALGGCLLSYASWLNGKPVRCLCVMAFFMITFRCDLLVMLAPLTLQMLVAGEIPFFSTLGEGLATSIGTLALTTTVDSYFWRKWVWPEGIVLFYNTVENNSSNWGVMPWHWYFTSALPRALNVSLLFALVGLSGVSSSPSPSKVEDTSFLGTLIRPFKFDSQDSETRAVWYYSFPAAVFVVLYSFLPHKELRFIFPALPLLTMAAAKGLDTLSINKADEDGGGSDKKPNVSWRSLMGVLAKLVRTTLLMLGGCLFVAFLLPSMHNYAGGIALRSLHRNHIIQAAKSCSTGGGDKGSTCSAVDRNFQVHMDVGAAMTGVTRFGQIQPRRKNVSVSYSKQEDLPATKAAYRDFDWLVRSDITAPYLSGFTVVEEIEGFDALTLNISGAYDALKGMLAGKICPLRIELLSPVSLRLAPKMWIMQNNRMKR